MVDVRKHQKTSRTVAITGTRSVVNVIQKLGIFDIRVSHN